MIVEEARNEGAERGAGRLEGRVRGRRLMQLAGDRRELVEVEGVRIAIAVPADDVAWVILHDVDRVAAAAS